MDEDRFWSKTQRVGECLLWTGATFTTGAAAGIGAYHSHCFEPLKRAHRLAYCLANGVSYQSMHRIPIQQTCGHKLCCEPAHLKVTTFKSIHQEKKHNAKKSTYRFAASYA